MKYQFTETQVNVLLNSLDIALKQVGLKGVYTIVELFQILQNPKELGDNESNGFKVYEFNENQLQSLNQILDIAIKATGLNGAHLILDVVQTLQHPVQPVENK